MENVNVRENIDSYQLPNAAPLGAGDFRERVTQLGGRYRQAVAIVSKIKHEQEKEKEQVESRLKKIRQAEPAETFNEAVAWIQESPHQAAGPLMRNLKFLPGEKPLAELALELAPEVAAGLLMENLWLFLEENQLPLAEMALEKAPKEAAGPLMWDLVHLPEEKRSPLAKMALEKAPKEATGPLMENLWLFPEEKRSPLAELALEKAPKEAAESLMRNREYLPEENQLPLAELALEKALEKAPKEAAGPLMRNLWLFPEENQLPLAEMALEKAPKEAAESLMENLGYFPEENQLPLAEMALEKAPKEAADPLMWNLECLPEENQLPLAKMALEKAPEEAAELLMENLSLFSEEEQLQLKTLISEISLPSDESVLEEYETKNPRLYEDAPADFFREEFAKDGSRTILLGGELINKVILRIIPTEAFVGWAKALEAVDTWKAAGFDYVPIEPIIKAHPCQNQTETRVYAGVLGMNLADYLKKDLGKKHHGYVRGRADKIRETLVEMEIEHGHDFHDRNFCILHERTATGEIDWERPPRVYCIDFDQTTSS